MRPSLAWLAAAFLAGLLAASSGSVLAHGGWGRGGHWGEAGSGRLAEVLASLELDEEQRAALERFREAADEARAAPSRATTAEVVAAALSSEPPAAGSPERQALHDELDARLEARRQALHAVLDRFLDFAATLTPEQRELLRRRLAAWRARMWDEATRNRCWWWMDGSPRSQP